MTGTRAAITALIAVFAFLPASTFASSKDASKNPVTIAAPYSNGINGDIASFFKGAHLAVKELNKSGGLNGHNVLLQPLKEDKPPDAAPSADEVNDALRMADRTVAIKDLVAVIGHSSSAAALPASSIYQRDDVLFLATSVTDGALANLDLNLVFMLTPNSRDQAKAIASYALHEELKNIVVLSDRSETAKRLSRQFEEFMTVNGGEIIFRSLFSKDTAAMTRLLLFVLDNSIFDLKDVDAFYIASASPEPMQEFIRKGRELGLKQPIFGPELLLSESVTSFVGTSNMKDVMAVSLYDMDTIGTDAVKFIASYKEEFDDVPDQEAAIAYDAVKLLAYAVEKTKSLEADKLASFLSISRYRTKFIGVTGPVAFDAGGRIVDTHIYVERHNGSAFHTVATYELPVVSDIIQSDDAIQNQASPESTQEGQKPKTSKD
ncbi:ABC transporter substrate-binding protein [Labrenzia sp. PHM005]|uniref:ABC transporter substrate-binding protein n=1 Tax=Labrenzia sp. PHM005 TaxID=2590016 RepID=UPI00143CD490|nr:ABC transporter substrate-binding protein [Labrenzia sp. PHM005]